MKIKSNFKTSRPTYHHTLLISANLFQTNLILINSPHREEVKRDKTQSLIKYKLIANHRRIDSRDIAAKQIASS